MTRIACDRCDTILDPQGRTFVVCWQCGNRSRFPDSPTRIGAVEARPALGRDPKQADDARRWSLVHLVPHNAAEQDREDAAFLAFALLCCAVVVGAVWWLA